MQGRFTNKVALVTGAGSRGHYPAEIFALERGIDKAYDGHLIVPAFFEGGRYTINDTHYQEGCQ